MTKKVKVIKLDEDHRLYFFSRRIIYKERKGGRLMTRFSGVSLNGLLGSPLVSDDVKKKILQIIEKLG